MKMDCRSLSSLSENAFIPSHEHGHDTPPSSQPAYLNGRTKRGTSTRAKKLLLTATRRTLMTSCRKWNKEKYHAPRVRATLHQRVPLLTRTRRNGWKRTVRQGMLLVLRSSVRGGQGLRLQVRREGESHRGASRMVKVTIS